MQKMKKLALLNIAGMAQIYSMCHATNWLSIIFIEHNICQMAVNLTNFQIGIEHKLLCGLSLIFLEYSSDTDLVGSIKFSFIMKK